MKILFLSPVLPRAPRDGDRLRAFHWLRELSRRHEVTLASFCEPGETQQGLKGSPVEDWVQKAVLVPLGSWQRRGAVLSRLFSGLPANVTSAMDAGMAGRVAGLLGERFDLVFAYRLKMAPYAFAARRAGIPIALDLTDSMRRYWEERLGVEKAPWARWWARLEARRLSRYEPSTAAAFDACFINSRVDWRELAAQGLASRVQVLPNGVDTKFFKPGGVRKTGQDIVFVGQMSYAPNVDAVLHFSARIFPAIRARIPRARFVIVGGRPARAVSRLAGQPGVEVTGWVEDTRPFVQRAAVSVCPVRFGAGRQNKVLESFAMGTPVVASPLAAEGAEALAGRHLLVAGEAAEFSAQVLRLMEDPALAQKVSKQALSFVRLRYNWAASGRALEKTLLACRKNKTWKERP